MRNVALNECILELYLICDLSCASCVGVGCVNSVKSRRFRSFCDGGKFLKRDAAKFKVVYTF